MTSFGTLTDYRTGDPIRSATAAEWRRTADKVNGAFNGDPTGAFDLDGQSVWVDGGPEVEISADDVRALRDQSAAAGDSEQVRLCDMSLEDDGSQESIEAHKACVAVILDTRMELA